VGLHEFADMAFILHALRPADLFLDVGANIGSYTVLAAGAVGCDCVSIEPIAAALRHLRDNVALNDIGEKVQIEACAAGEHSGTARMTSALDTVNHIVEGGAAAAGTVEVPCRPLDSLVGDRCPAIMKVDVEGYELQALKGGARLLDDERLRACI